MDEDGQMSLYMQGGRVAEPQVSGQMSIEDVLAEWEKTKRAAEAALQEAEQRKLESAKARALQEAEELLGRLADVIPMLDSGLTPKDLLDQKYLSKDGQPNDSAVSMVTNMNQFLQQEIDRLSDENAQMDEQLAAVGASPVGDYMANAGVAAEDAAQNVVAAGVQELMAEEELPEIAMPEALAEADDTMEAGTSAEDVDAASVARSQLKRHRVDAAAECAHALLADCGASALDLSANEACMLERGLSSLDARMQAHFDRARALAEYLAANEMVRNVRYPGLTSHPDHAVATGILEHGFGPAVEFDLIERSAGELFDTLPGEFRTSPAGGSATRLSAPRGKQGGAIRLFAGTDDPLVVASTLDNALRKLATL